MEIPQYPGASCCATTTTVEDGELAGLAGFLGKFAHEGRGVRDKAAHRRVQLSQAEKLQRQRLAIAIDAGHVAAPHQPVEHAVELVGTAAQPLGDLRLRQATIDVREQFD